MYLATGGRIGDRIFTGVLSRVADRKLRRIEQAPVDMGGFLSFHIHALSEDGAWLNYLQREALTHGGGAVPREQDRLPVIEAQVEEIRRRQQAGLIDLRLDPRLVRLLAFALASYPRLLPQITRMTTGTTPDDPAFVAEWETFLHDLGGLLEGHRQVAAPTDLTQA